MQVTITSATIECQRFLDFIIEPLATNSFGKIRPEDFRVSWSLHATVGDRFRNAKNSSSLAEKLAYFKEAADRKRAEHFPQEGGGY